MKYVLITPARNEEAFIGKTLDSVVAQTLRLSDGLSLMTVQRTKPRKSSRVMQALSVDRTGSPTQYRGSQFCCQRLILMPGWSGLSRFSST